MRSPKKEKYRDLEGANVLDFLRSSKSCFPNDVEDRVATSLDDG